MRRLGVTMILLVLLHALKVYAGSIAEPHRWFLKSPAGNSHKLEGVFLAKRLIVAQDVNVLVLFGAVVNLRGDELLDVGDGSVGRATDVLALH